MRPECWWTSLRRPDERFYELQERYARNPRVLGQTSQWASWRATEFALDPLLAFLTS